MHDLNIKLGISPNGLGYLTVYGSSWSIYFGMGPGK
jgi:hypothetical protein